MAKLRKCPHCDAYQGGSFYGVNLQGQRISVCRECVRVINPPIDSSNSTCRHLGHEWANTTAANWRKCGRENCGAVERLVDDVWQAVAKKRGSRETQPVELVQYRDEDGKMCSILKGAKVQPGAYVDQSKVGDLQNYWR
jgi:ribosome-binding protein aMBF1 (putative translation factor)